MAHGRRSVAGLSLRRPSARSATWVQHGGGADACAPKWESWQLTIPSASPGRISPLNGVEPEDLRIADLESRLSAGPIHEVILALGTDVEGDATSFYLAKRLASRSVKVTRIAHGLPAGSGLEYTDELTLSRALEGRTELK